MITTPTVLILGAGASVEYEFPSGHDLKWLIIDSLRKVKPQHESIFHSLGSSSQAAHDLSREFQSSGVPSIDAFLEHRSSFVEVGKIAIAFRLCRFEKRETLFTAKSDGCGLYQYLGEALNTTFDHFEENQLSVLTYNYDRSLETYLFTSLLNKYGKSEEAVADKVKKLPIVHLHGQLGPLPWQNSSGSREYAPSEKIEDLAISAKGIRVIHEDVDVKTDQSFRHAHELIAIAQRVIFLGFGYHKTNLDRILDAFHSKQSVCGTCYGLKHAEIRTLEHKIFRDLIFEPGGDDQKSREFLRDRIVL